MRLAANAVRADDWRDSAEQEQRMKVLFALILIASPCLAQTNVPPTNPEAACGANDVNFQVKADPRGQHLPIADPGKALVYFIETPRVELFSGTATVKIALDGAWVGANHGDSYFFVTVEPGEHHLCARWQSSVASEQQVALNSLTAEAGMTYYFRTRVTGDNRVGYSLDLAKTNSDEAQLLIARSPYSISRAKK
jgi:hypothetical protein